MRRFRRIHWKLFDTFEYLPALIYAYVAAYLIAPVFQALKSVGLRSLVEYVERNWVVSLWLRDAQWRVLDTFDAITPEIATTHIEQEVAEWMAAAGVEAVRRTPWCETSAVGLREQKLIVSLMPIVAGAERVVSTPSAAEHEDDHEDHTPDLLPLTVSPWDEERRVAA